MNIKALKSIGAGLLALAVAQSAFATTIKITGSTAYRKALYGAIIEQLGSGTVKVAYFGNAALSSANQATFTNGTDTIECCMAGSTGGVNWLINNLTVATDKDRTHPETAWISTSGSAGWATASATSTTISGGSLLGAPTWEAPATADIAMSDAFQDSTPFSSSATGVTLVPSNGGPVGVVRFLFGKGVNNTNNVPAANYNRLTNLTKLQFRALSASGILPLSFFTGDPSDTNYDVVLTGRDNDSGTRLVTFKETYAGDANTTAKQYLVSPSATGGTVTITGLTFSGGSTGYASGGHVKNALNSTQANGVTDSNGLPFILVGYLGSGDASTNTVTFEGTSTSDSTVALGQNSFWSYEFMYYKDTLDGTKSGIADSIATKIDTYAGQSGTQLSLMTVSRDTEGGVINPL